MRSSVEAMQSVSQENVLLSETADRVAIAIREVKPRRYKCSILVRPTLPTPVDTRFRGYDGAVLREGFTPGLNTY